MSNPVVEASGCAASRKHPGFLYVHNDYYNGHNLIVIRVGGHSAQVYNVITLLGDVHQNDWEDIAVGPCGRGDSRTCIYILDAGSGANNIYRFEEPDTITTHTLTLRDVYKFNWTESRADTIMVDNDANVFIIGLKRGGHSLMAKLPEYGWTVPFGRVWINSDQYYYMIPHSKTNPLGGDISPDGTEVLIKTYHDIFYYQVGANDDLLSLLTKPGLTMPYREVWGESVCWAPDGSAYYTVAEGDHPTLYMYQRS